jgi:hypothetical protein
VKERGEEGGKNMGKGRNQLAEGSRKVPNGNEYKEEEREY